MSGDEKLVDVFDEVKDEVDLGGELGGVDGPKMGSLQLDDSPQHSPPPSAAPTSNGLASSPLHQPPEEANLTPAAAPAPSPLKEETADLLPEPPPLPLPPGLTVAASGTSSPSGRMLRSCAATPLKIHSSLMIRRSVTRISGSSLI